MKKVNELILETVTISNGRKTIKLEIWNNNSQPRATIIKICPLYIYGIYSSRLHTPEAPEEQWLLQCSNFW